MTASHLLDRPFTHRCPPPLFPYNPGSLLSVIGPHPGRRQPHPARATALENQDPLTRDRILAKRRVALLFYESSTRTRTSFELAAKALGADTTLVSSLSSSIEKGESLKDTGLTLRALGAEAIILRHNSSGAPGCWKTRPACPCSTPATACTSIPPRPCSTCAPSSPICGPATTAGRRETLAGVTVTIVGDILHSRVARSNMLLLPRLGARVVLCGPKELLPEMAASAGPGIEIERDFEAALRQSQVIMMLRIQAERLAGLQLDLEEYKVNYQLTGPSLAALAPDAIVMHPAPSSAGLRSPPALPTARNRASSNRSPTASPSAWP